MITPEKNEIDIGKLFSWGKKFDLFDEKGKSVMTYFMRLPGDSDINRARVYALRKSADRRRELKAEDSDIRIAFIAEKDLLTAEELRSFIMLYRTKDLYLKATRETDVAFPKEPGDNATLEEQEKYQEEIDDYPNKVEEVVKEKLIDIVKREEKNLAGRNFEDLYTEYEQYAINEICENEMIKKYKEICIFFGSYTDDGYSKRVFKSVEEFQDLNVKVRQQFFDHYEFLEVDIEDLKKSPEVML